jgi:hypothetical protein
MNVQPLKVVGNFLSKQRYAGGSNSVIVSDVAVFSIRSLVGIFCLFCERGLLEMLIRMRLPIACMEVQALNFGKLCNVHASVNTHKTRKTLPRDSNLTPQFVESVLEATHRNSRLVLQCSKRYNCLSCVSTNPTYPM